MLYPDRKVKKQERQEKLDPQRPVQEVDQPNPGAAHQGEDRHGQGSDAQGQRLDDDKCKVGRPGR